ncbi:MAG: VWA domain-containing protein [Bacteroidetes bacterium]|nr:VWA domain-containing protein [Bacteroidota bacterium]
MGFHDVLGGRKRRRGPRVHFLFAALLLFGISSALQAQPNLNFKRVTVNFPTIELYYSVGCDGNPAYNMTKPDFRILENGEEVKDFTMWCPDPTIRCALSASLVFDASGSMAGSGNTGAKQAGHAFIDLMDGVVDEAAIVWFTHVVTVYQQMTTVKLALHAAVDALPATGATAVWDGIYAGIIELINNGVNPCRAVIVMTDGGDASSTRTVAEIISLANRHRIRVFTIGLGSSINSTELEMIAQLTGGKYYQTPNAGQLAAIYQEITTIIFQGFQECVITYERDCADGGMRTVELQLKNFCGGTDVKTKTYRAPLDSTTFADLQFTLDDAIAFSGEEVVVNLAVEAQQPLDLYPLNFTLLYDRQALQLLWVAPSPGSPITPQSIATAGVANGTAVMIQKPWSPTGSRSILQFHFRASPLPGITDSLLLPLEVVGPTFSQGCWIPRFDPGSVLVLRDAALLECRLVIPPVLADSANGRYDPMPVPVVYEVVNVGTIASAPIDATLMLPTGLSLAGPDAPDHFTKALQPAILQPGDTGRVTWMVEHPLTQVERRFKISVQAGQFPGDDGVVCDDSLIIPVQEGLHLAPRCYVPDSLHFDAKLLQYTPNPFTVRLTCINDGSVPLRNVTGRLLLPSGLAFDPPTQRQTVTFVPSDMMPWKPGNLVPEIEWTVAWTGLVGSEQNPVLSFHVSAEDGTGVLIDTVVTSCGVRIPGVPLEWECALVMPDSLGLNAGETDVEPNPFSVRYELTNRSIIPARVDRVQLRFPAQDLGLDPSSPNPALVHPDTLLDVGRTLLLEWKLYAPPRGKRRMPLITVESVDDGGGTNECSEYLPIAALQFPSPELHCSLSYPPVVVDSVNRTYLPMPFPITVTVTNTGDAPAEEVQATITLPPGYSIAPPDAPTQVTKMLAPATLDPGKGGTARWLLWHDPSPFPLDTASVYLDLLARNQDPHRCATTLSLPGIPGVPFSFRLAAGGSTMFCDGDSVTLDAGSGYLSYLWNTSETTRSISVRQMGSYWCQTMSGDGRPGFSDTLQVVVIPLPAKPVITRQLDSLVATDADEWQWFRDGHELTGATRRSYLVDQPGGYRVRVKNAFGCEAWSDQYDVTVLGLDDAPVPGESVLLYPNPTTGIVTVKFTDPAAASAVIRITDILGRERYFFDGPAPTGSLSVDLADSPNGWYFVYVRAGDTSTVQALQLRR